ASSWSPRERGWTGLKGYIKNSHRVVPARAGVDRTHRASRSRPGGGPRASGGGPAAFTLEKFENAWSPRERGWTIVLVLELVLELVVPARAGVDPGPSSSSRACTGGPRASGGGPSGS